MNHSEVNALYPGHHNLDLHPMTSADSDYLYQLAETTFRHYVEEVFGEWNEQASRKYYRTALAAGEIQAVFENDIRVGVVSILRPPTHIQLELLLVEPDHQNRGIGTAIIRELFKQALESARPVRLRVLASNPARKLYQRLGFVVTETTKERYFMEWRAGG